MYFPYFYAREAELNALAHRAAHLGSPQQIVPILEPAAKPSSNVGRYARKIERTLAGLSKHNATAYLVTNPHLGTFSDSTQAAQWLAAATAGPLSPVGSTHPAFKIRSATTLPELEAFASTYTGRSLGLIVSEQASVTAADIHQTFAGESVRLFLFPKVDPDEYDLTFGKSSVVRVGDNFNTQARNADYIGEEVFGKNHLTYKAGGRPGFSDWTVLPPTVTFSGGPIGAAVIHLTFLDTNSVVWVQHFVSDETSVSEGNFQSKLLEAIAHASAAIAAQPSKFLSTDAISDYQAQGLSSQATSPARNKQLQLEHHLSVVAHILGL